MQGQVLAPHAVIRPVARSVAPQLDGVFAGATGGGGAHSDGRLDVRTLAPPAGGWSCEGGREEERRVCIEKSTIKTKRVKKKSKLVM